MEGWDRAPLAFVATRWRPPRLCPKLDRRFANRALSIGPVRLRSGSS